MYWISNIDTVVTIITVITALGTIFGVIVPLAIKIYGYHSKIKYVKRTLHLLNKHVLITCGIFPGAHKTRTAVNDMVDLKEVRCLKAISDFCATVNINVYLQDEYLMTDIDEIHIGGPVRNVTVSNLMTNYFENTFKILLPHEDKGHKNLPANDKFIEYTESETGFAFGAGGNRAKYLTDAKYGDYAILIRLIDRNEHKAMHILFGGHGLGTTKAVEYFTKHSKEIYNFTKERGVEKSDYFFMLHVNNDGRHDSHIGLTDLTDIMFEENPG